MLHIGTTRDFFDDRRVLSLEYEAFAEMAILEMKKVVEEIRTQWTVEKVFIEHKLGMCRKLLFKPLFFLR